MPSSDPRLLRWPGPVGGGRPSPAHGRAQGAPSVSTARPTGERALRTRVLGPEGGLGSRKRRERGRLKGPERGGPGWEGREGAGPAAFA